VVVLLANISALNLMQLATSAILCVMCALQLIKEKKNGSRSKNIPKSVIASATITGATANCMHL